MGKVKGEDVILYVQDIQNGKCEDPIACGRSITFNMDIDMIETSITDNGKFRTYVPGAGKVTANIEGLVAILNTQMTVFSGTISLYFLPALPPVYGFIIDKPNICIPVGAIIYVNGGDFDNAPFPVLTCVPDGLGNTVITVTGTFPSFTPFSGTITYDQHMFSTERIYDAMMNNKLLRFEFYETDDSGHYLIKSFMGYFNSISEVASFDNIVTFTADVTANGVPTIDYG